MFHRDIPELSADLLLKREPAIQVNALAETLNDIMAPAGLAFERAESSEIILSAGRLHVMLESQDEALPPDWFPRALTSKYGAIMGEDWGGMIRQHQAALTVTAGPGRMPGDKSVVDEDLQDLLLSVAHVAMTYLAHLHNPMAVHWAPSGQIFSMPRLMAMADMLFPLPLFVHPEPFSSGRRDGENQVVGFRLHGAEDLIGFPLRMAEAPARLDWLVERALAFVDYTRETGGPIPPGDSFGCAEDERFAVTEDPETGGLLLTLKERDGMLMLQPLASQHAA